MADITGETIRALRKELGLTQEQFARRLEVGTATLRDWEANRHQPRGLYRKGLERELKKDDRKRADGGMVQDG